MTRWEELRVTIEKTRAERKEKDWVHLLIVQVRRAVEKKVCASHEPFRIKRTGRTIEVSARGGVTAKSVKADIPAIALLGLDAIEDAKLTFRVLLTPDQN